MSAPTAPRGRVAVIGAGPAGMAAALSVHQAGHDVVLLERYREARPAGNILNLWPPPVLALRLLGVDTSDLGAPCHTEFRSVRGRPRVRVTLPEDVVRDYGGGFIGLLRPELYERLLAALPHGVLQVNRAVEGFDQDESDVRIRISDGDTLDVASSSAPTASIPSSAARCGATSRSASTTCISSEATPSTRRCPPSVVCASSSTAGRCREAGRRSGTTGRDGFQWWVLGAHDARTPFTADPHATAAAMGAEFAAPLPQLIAATDAADVQRWVLRDRTPLDQWSKGRATIVGDAAHPTSPYAAYGAGMAIEDGYFLGRRLAGVNIRDPAAVRAALDAFEGPRKPHTKRQVQQAWMLGKIFHHAPAPLRPVRDAVLDRTPFLQKVVGERSPGEIIEQIAAIDEAERHFSVIRRASS